MIGDEIHRLKEAARLVYEREAAGLARFRAEADGLDARIGELRQAGSSAGTEDLHPAVIGPARERWNAWRMGEITRLQRRRAVLAAGEADARDRAAKALGRLGAIARLTGTDPMEPLK